MASPNADDNTGLAARVTDLELLHTHLDRLFAELSEVLNTIQQRVDRLETRLQHVASALESQSDAGNEPRSLEDERPPHY